MTTTISLSRPIAGYLIDAPTIGTINVTARVANGWFVGYVGRTADGRESGAFSGDTDSVLSCIADDLAGHHVGPVRRLCKIPRIGLEVSVRDALGIHHTDYRVRSIDFVDAVLEDTRHPGLTVEVALASLDF